MGINPRKKQVKPATRSEFGSKKVKPPTNELLYYGRHICAALVSRRRDAIIRVYCIEDMVKPLGELLRWCAQFRKAYHIVTSEELQRITGSVHHEGVAILALSPVIGSQADALALLRKQAQPVIFLDGVQNPHNIGTIMRVMASFGWSILVGGASMPPLTAAAARMSEGGSEFVRMFSCENPLEFFKDLKSLSYKLVGTSSHAKTSLYEHALQKLTVLILGGEVEGMSPALEAIVDKQVLIPGTGQVESLNVAVACGVLLGEYTRTFGIGPGAPDSLVFR